MGFVAFTAYAAKLARAFRREDKRSLKAFGFIPAAFPAG
jgi:hypothetical protein